MSDEIEPEEDGVERRPQEGEPFNAGDRSQVRERAKKGEKKTKLRAKVLQDLLKTEDGREFLGWLLFTVCGMNGTTENAAYDTNAVHFREGQRAVGLVLQQQALQANKPLYIVLLGEHLN